MSEPARDSEVSALEAALAGLAPAPAVLDRDRLMFRAGLAASRRPGWLWPGATGVLVLATATLAVLLALRPGPVVVERVVDRDVPVRVERQPEQGPPARETDEPSWGGEAGRYFQTREQLLRRGLDGVPVPPPLAPAPALNKLNGEW
jgi:hypothetical protein